MIQRIVDETAKTYFRASRIYFVGDCGWYFLTREGFSFGPYTSKINAKDDLSLFLYFLEMGDWDEELTTSHPGSCNSASD